MDVCEGIYTHGSKISKSTLNLIIDSHDIMYYVIVMSDDIVTNSYINLYCTN